MEKDLNNIETSELEVRENAYEETESNAVEEVTEPVEEVTEPVEEVTKPVEEVTKPVEPTDANSNVHVATVDNTEAETVDTQNKAKKQKKEKKENKWVSRIIIILLIIIIILLLLRSCGGSGNNGGVVDNANPTVTSAPDGPKPTKPAGGEDFDEEGDDWDGEKDTVFKETEQEFITIPGFSYIAVNEKNKEVQLFNYPENTVYFKYTITETVSTETVQRFEFNGNGKPTADDLIELYKQAKEAIKGLEKNYKAEKDDNGCYFTLNGEKVQFAEHYEIKELSKGYAVIKQTEEMVFCTGGIGPGKSVKWNVYDTLGVGDYSVNMRVNTFDEKTKEECWGANQVVDVHIE